MKKICLFIVLFFSVLGIAHNFLRKQEFQIKAEKTREEEEEGKKTDQPDKFQRLHQGMRTRDGETGPGYDYGYKWNELRAAKRNSSARKRNAGGKTTSNGVIEWKERGPGNVPGRMRALFNVPGDLNNNTWLAGAATGGIWRTTNGGNSWSEQSGDFPALPISSFAANATASVIYAGTGEFVSSIYSAIGNGIFYSTDKGLTWTQIPSTNNNPDFSIITRLIVDPTDPNIIVATTVPHNLTTDATSSIMRSADGGATWSNVKEITGIFEQVVFTPGNFDIQYASQHGVGIWKSVNGGVTWNLASTNMSPSGRLEIAVSAVNPNKIFVSAEGPLSGTDSDLYTSSDAGISWSLVDVNFNGAAVDFFEGQGFYDNTIMCDPFNENRVYFGGVSLFRSTITSGSTQVDNFKMKEEGTPEFLFLQSFDNVEFDNNRLNVGDFANNIAVEVRFGPGQSQKAHRFTVPDNRTSNVGVNEYTYRDYVTVPFEVWDITNNKQLMVSFRDQNKNNTFDLATQYLTADGTDFLLNSREYIFISNVDYNASIPNSAMIQAGGHEHLLMYNFFPCLSPGATWNEDDLPNSKITIRNNPMTKLAASTVTAADGRGAFDGKNKSNQIDLTSGVHADHHFMVPVIISENQKTFKILLANDGGVFVTKVSATPGITEGDWIFKGLGLNTSQFYGADKKPGEEEYIGGMQDNGTRISPFGKPATASSNYVYGLGGDGFEVIWNSKDPNKIMGSTYNGQISRSLNGGSSWQASTNGVTPGVEFSFVTKLANSKDYPDRVFTVGTQGVYVSHDFGGTWQLTSIPEKLVVGSPMYLDVEVSRANPDIVWTGSGMNPGIRNLHVSINGGKTFSSTNNFTLVPLGNITKLASHPTQPNTAYALFSFANGPKILRTTDLGQTWADISGFGAGASSTNGFPDVAVFCLYVRPDNPNIIWAGTEIGIVESLDNGSSWALLDDFPNVSVWDMKGQDDQVVLATHGRGIWTALINQDQLVIRTPEIVASGTSPDKKLVLRIASTENFDSLQIYIGPSLSKRIQNINPGNIDTDFANISPGAKEIKIISFKGNIPCQSALYRMQHLDILPQKNSYSTFFKNLSDVTVDGLTLQSLPNSPPPLRSALQTDHNYSINKNYQVILRTPISVSSTLPVLFYSDIAIVEPFNDSVVVEATANGLDWTPLAQGYDATGSSLWETAYTNKSQGTKALFVKHEIDFGSKFSPGDVLLFRLRMISGETVTSWGWALDYISIQELPLAINPPYETNAFSVYPNPSNGPITIAYELKKTSAVSLEVLDIFGRRILSSDMGWQNSGLHKELVALESQSGGTYVVILHTTEGKMTRKILIHR